MKSKQAVFVFQKRQTQLTKAKNTISGRQNNKKKFDMLQIFFGSLKPTIEKKWEA